MHTTNQHFPHSDSNSAAKSKFRYSCRVCGRKFRDKGPVWERVVEHIESKHPAQALPWRQEFAYLHAQREEEQV